MRSPPPRAVDNLSIGSGAGEERKRHQLGSVQLSGLPAATSATAQSRWAMMSNSIPFSHAAVNVLTSGDRLAATAWQQGSSLFGIDGSDSQSCLSGLCHCALNPRRV